MLEMGDVVAIKHDSGDGVLRYTPVWIKSISYNLNDFTTDIEAYLYLSAAWDERVQPIEPLLTSTLNPNFPLFPPEPIGTHGGFSEASDYQGRQYPKYDYFNHTRYSPDGVDRI